MDNKRRFVTSSAAAAAAADDDDIITNFPEDLINRILERLLVKDAVRTSVLSKRWRYRWTTMRTLKFSRQSLQFSKKFLRIGTYQHNGFIRVISHIMIHHHGPIFSFYVCIPEEINLDSFQEVDHWMLILSRKSVKVLGVMNFNRTYIIPSSVFSCLELRWLELYNCIFKAPLECQGFPNLEVLTLRRISFGDNLGRTVINLPQLKSLILDSCQNVNNFNIEAGKLQRLRVVSCPDAMLLRLFHSEHLYEVCICLLNPIEDFLRVERLNLTMMLSNLPNIEFLNFDGYFLKFLAAEKFPKQLPHAVKWLEQLEFNMFNFGDLDQVQGALCMLRNSPNLKTLHMRHIQGPDADLESTSNYLESPDCFGQTLSMLETVEITHLEGSRPELLFIKLLLDHSPHLENMIIRPKEADAEERLNIARDVMMFPRASPKAKMVFLNSMWSAYCS